MEYAQNFIVEFARRTRANLDFIESANWEEKLPYEVTQLMNSLLGLVVFPHEGGYWSKIEDQTLDELASKEWPVIEMPINTRQVGSLQQLIEAFRHAISHCNIEFVSKAESNQIGGMAFSTRTKMGKGPVDWKASLSLEDLRLLAVKLSDLLVEKFGQNERKDS